MDFGLIQRKGKDIEMEEWLVFVRNANYLETMESKEGVNPFNGEKVKFHREHAAYFLSGTKIEGNISLEQGILFTTGVPQAICEIISSHFQAVFSKDDRS